MRMRWVSMGAFALGGAAIRTTIMVSAWMQQQQQHQHQHQQPTRRSLDKKNNGRCPTTTTTTTTLGMINLLDAFTGGGYTNVLKPVTSPLPYGDPILPVEADTVVTLAVRERGLSFTGEDFDVLTLPTTEVVGKVRGALWHLPGKDKMRITNPSGNVVAVLDRKLVALTPTYDIYRGTTEKIAWIEKVAVALFRDCFEVHLESTPRMGPIKGPAAYKLHGDFLDRQFVMKSSDKDETVAVISKTGWFPQFDACNHYQVQVAPGMDVGLVVACVSAIDEEFDEEHQKQSAEEAKKKKEGGGGWFG